MQKNNKRSVNGILLLDKPTGMSSNAALQTAKRAFQAKKAGHTGSLDPLASGLLPLCFGEATKFSQFLLDADKAYVVTAVLGVSTETGDAEGEVVSTKTVPVIKPKKLEKILSSFRGVIQQVPSMYSALKHNGQPLYKLARQGIVVERPARELTIYSLEVLAYREQSHELDMHVRCSKGTYVRTLVEDIGHALGCGAHVSALRRIDVAPFDEPAMVSLDAVKALGEAGDLAALDAMLLPLDSAVAAWPMLALSSSKQFYIQQGQSVFVPAAPTEGLVRLYGPERFIGMGEVLDDGRISPKRLVAN